MKAIGLGLTALVGGTHFVDPFHPTSASNQGFGAQVVPALGRRLEARMFGAHLIVTNDSSIAYFKAPGPAAGCSIDYDGNYVFVDSIFRHHNTFFTDCSVPEGIRQVWIDVFTMDNGDAYWDRGDYRRGFPCELGNFSALNPKQVVSSGSVVAKEICTSAPTVQPQPTDSPTASPGQNDPDRGQSTGNHAPAGLEVGAVVATAVAAGACLYVRRVRSQQALEARLHAVQVEQADIQARTEALPPPGAAPQALHQTLIAPPSYDPPSYAQSQQEVVVLHLGTPQVELSEVAPPRYSQ